MFDVVGIDVTITSEYTTYKNTTLEDEPFNFFCYAVHVCERRFLEKLKWNKEGGEFFY